MIRGQQQRYTRKRWQRQVTDNRAHIQQTEKTLIPKFLSGRGYFMRTCDVWFDPCCRRVERVSDCAVCILTSYSGCKGVMLILEKWRVLFCSGDVDDTVVFVTCLKSPE